MYGTCPRSGERSYGPIRRPVQLPLAEDEFAGVNSTGHGNQRQNDTRQDVGNAAADSVLLLHDVGFISKRGKGR